MKHEEKMSLEDIIKSKEELDDILRKKDPCTNCEIKCITWCTGKKEWYNTFKAFWRIT